MLSLILALATSAPAPAALATPATPADGTYTYVSSMSGVPIGKTAITVKHDAASIVLNEQGGGTFNGQQGTVKDTLTLDPAQLAPTAYTLSASVDGRPVNMAVSFKGGNAFETGDVTQKTYDLAQVATHFVVLDLGPFSGWFALPAQMQAWNGAPAVAIVPAMGSGITIAPDAALKAARPKSVPAGDSVISVSTPTSFSVWYDPKTMLVDRVDFPAQGVSIARQP